MSYKEFDTTELTEIDSVGSFIKEIQTLREKIDNNSVDLYFRGQEVEFWDIEPSIFRNDMLSIEHNLMQIPLQRIPMEFKDFDNMFDIMAKSTLWDVHQIIGFNYKSFSCSIFCM